MCKSCILILTQLIVHGREIIRLLQLRIIHDDPRGGTASPRGDTRLFGDDSSFLSFFNFEV